MKISQEDIRRLAKLARLEPADTIVAPLSAQLTVILDYIEQLNTLPGLDAEPLEAPGTFAPGRPDAARALEEGIDPLSNAPDREEGCFRVPRVLE
jgi:aspartyl-tRNA(Asn)/glutamyl-tRNA(Gln) amidotransferase subunit C